MPIVKTISNSDITSLITPIEQEQRISNNLLKSKIEIKDTALSRMTDIKSEVIYYHQKTTGGNDYLANIANIHTLDPNVIQFQEIEKFIIICQGEISTSTSTEDYGKMLNLEGVFKTLPNTLKPLPNDHFIMFTAGKKNLYRVTGVNKATVEDDAAYECQYQLVEEDAVEGIDKIKRLVIEQYIFEYKHVGTSFRTIYRKDEFQSVKDLSLLYTQLGSNFNDLFYDKRVNTYILKYTTDSNSLYDVPYTTPEGEPPIRVEENELWTGSEFYDRELMEFITRHNLFQYINKRIIRPTKFVPDLQKMYTGTIFYALEQQNYRRFTFTHFVPVPIVHSSPSNLPHLYGKVDLVPTLEILQGAIYLYHPQLVYKVRSIPANVPVNEIAVHTVNNILELCVDTIALYVNKIESDYIGRLTLILNNLDKLLIENTRTEFNFYLFPLLSYIAKKMMEKLSDKSFSIY